jgi:hypothetical protein
MEKAVIMLTSRWRNTLQQVQRKRNSGEKRLIGTKKTVGKNVVLSENKVLRS